MTRVPTETHRGQTHGQRRSHVSVKAHIEAMQPQAKGHLGPPEARRGLGGFSVRNSGGTTGWPTPWFLVSDLQNYERKATADFSYPGYGHLGGSPSTLTQLLHGNFVTPNRTHHQPILRMRNKKFRECKQLVQDEMLAGAEANLGLSAPTGHMLAYSALFFRALTQTYQEVFV